MFDPRRYHYQYQPTISFPVSDDISLQQKPLNNNNNNNICQTKNINNDPHESGMCSPPLWTTNSNKSINYRSLSPESKTEAIERGQRELMEMVKNMPESSYELTLKDLVEEQQQQHHHHHHHVEENNNNINRVVKQKSLNNKKANKREGMMDKRSISTGHGNIDSGGFYLKMVFPISLGSSKKQYYKKNKESLVNNNNSKVSPRTSSVSDHGSVNKDWWKKKKSGSEYGGESDHSASTKRSASMSSSCSSRSNTSRHEMSASSCWPFTRKSEILSQK
ncbi:hypothetical protein RYX36_022009 [Vicia faba]